MCVCVFVCVFARVCMCRSNMHFLCFVFTHIGTASAHPPWATRQQNSHFKLHYIHVYTAENKEDLPNLGQLDLFQTP